MNSILFSACYGFPPNSYGYCGSSSFTKNLKEALVSKKTKKIEIELKKFQAQYKYLDFIGRENNLAPFDPKVVDAFWIGNSLLEEIPHKSLQKFIENDLFPRNSIRGKKLAKYLPENLVPHHSFNVLYVNFVTNRVERSINNFDLCCVTAGKIKSLNPTHAIVDRFSIDFNGEFIFGKKIEKVDIIRNQVKLVKNLKKNDIVALHWGMVVGKLNAKQLTKLKKYTKINFDGIGGLNNL
ncbi:MAG: DUF6390 family protein [Candidatus Micrarchaeota archaeon]